MGIACAGALCGDALSASETASAPAIAPAIAMRKRRGLDRRAMRHFRALII
jgi:hypothetical protein